MSFIVTPSTPAAPTVPGGVDTQVQFNDAGAFAGNSALTFNKTTGVLSPQDVTGTSLLMTIQPSAIAASTDISRLTLKTQDSSVSSALTGNVTVQPGDASGFASGGKLTLKGAVSSGFSPPFIEVNTDSAVAGILIQTPTVSVAGVSSKGVTIGLGGAGTGAQSGMFKLLVNELQLFRAYADTTGVRRIGFFSTVGIARPTTAYASAAFVANAGAAVQNVSTFDGYTIAQIVKAMRDYGLLT